MLGRYANSIRKPKHRILAVIGYLKADQYSDISMSIDDFRFTYNTLTI
jgi:hypothetical protein